MCQTFEKNETGKDIKVVKMERLKTEENLKYKRLIAFDDG